MNRGTFRADLGGDWELAHDTILRQKSVDTWVGDSAGWAAFNIVRLLERQFFRSE